MTRRNLSLVEPNSESETSILSSDAPLPSMPVLDRTSVFLDRMQMTLRETETDIEIVDQQIVAARKQHDAEVEAARLKFEATARALNWQRDDLTNVADRCKAALHE